MLKNKVCPKCFSKDFKVFIARKEDKSILAGMFICSCLFSGNIVDLKNDTSKLKLKRIIWKIIQHIPTINLKKKD